MTVAMGAAVAAVEGEVVVPAVPEGSSRGAEARAGQAQERHTGEGDVEPDGAAVPAVPEGGSRGRRGGADRIAW